MVSAVEQLSNGRVSQILSVIDTRVARICDAIGRGSTNVKEQTDLAKQQAETMSMFTVITTLFLPLTFFTSVGYLTIPMRRSY